MMKPQWFKVGLHRRRRGRQNILIFTCLWKSLRRDIPLTDSTALLYIIPFSLASPVNYNMSESSGFIFRKQNYSSYLKHKWMYVFAKSLEMKHWLVAESQQLLPWRYYKPGLPWELACSRRWESGVSPGSDAFRGTLQIAISRSGSCYLLNSPWSQN